MGDLGLFFNWSEFKCPCGTCETQVRKGLITRLDVIRGNLAQPITITSGYRCPEYNANVGGVADSAHTTGEAADIATPTNEFRYKLLEQAFRWFTRVGIYDKHVHLDISVTLPSPRCWVDVSK